MKIKKMTKEEIWNQYKKMIIKIAHRMSEKYRKPFEELLSEGIFGVFDRLDKWNPDRSGLSTYIHHCAYFKMLDYCLKPVWEIPMDVYNPEDNNPFIQQETKPNWFQSFINELTEETRHLVKIFFEAPEELYEAIRPNQPKTSQKYLRNYMVDVMDWSNEDVDLAFEEVSKCL